MRVMPRSSAALRSMRTLLDLKGTVSFRGSEGPPESLGMHMKLKKPSVLGNVTFTYASRPDEPVLRGQALEWGKCTNKASTWRFLRVRPPHW